MPELEPVETTFRQWVSGIYILAGLVILGLWVGLTSWGISLKAYPDYLISIGLAGYLCWALFAGLKGYSKKNASLGGAVGLLGFAFGSLLTLTPTGRIWEEEPAVTEWQAWCWLIATGFVLVSLESARRDRAKLNEALAKAEAEAKAQAAQEAAKDVDKPAMGARGD